VARDEVREKTRIVFAQLLAQLRCLRLGGIWQAALQEAQSYRDQVDCHDPQSNEQSRDAIIHDHRDAPNKRTMHQVRQQCQWEQLKKDAALRRGE
jgi:hypothetical protein